MADTALFETTRDQENCDLELGRSLRLMITGRFSAEVAQEFSDAVMIPTLPGTPERKRQDRVEAVLLPRLDKLLAGDAS